MLVLTRGLGQAIVLGEDIRLTIVAVRGKNIRLAIDAPAAVRIRRAELVDRPCSTAACEKSAGMGLDCQAA